MSDYLLPSDERGARRLQVAGAASAAAGVIHVAAAVPHFADDLLLGAGFVAIGWLQVLLAVAFLRGHDRPVALWAGLVLSLGAIGVWAISRTVGLPLGHPGAEQAGLSDLLTVGFEAVVVFVIVSRLTVPRMRWATRPVAIAGILAAWVVVVAGSAWAVADLARSGHAHAADEAPAMASSVLHRHTDDSLHLHERGEAHQHDDATVHLHPAESSEQSNAGPEGGTDSDGPEGHTHAPGEEH